MPVQDQPNKNKTEASKPNKKKSQITSVRHSIYFTCSGDERGKYLKTGISDTTNDGELYVCKRKTSKNGRDTEDGKRLDIFPKNVNWPGICTKSCRECFSLLSGQEAVSRSYTYSRFGFFCWCLFIFLNISSLFWSLKDVCLILYLWNTLAGWKIWKCM